MDYCKPCWGGMGSCCRARYYALLGQLLGSFDSHDCIASMLPISGQNSHGEPQAFALDTAIAISSNRTCNFSSPRTCTKTSRDLLSLIKFVNEVNPDFLRAPKHTAICCCYCYCCSCKRCSSSLSVCNCTSCCSSARLRKSSASWEANSGAEDAAPPARALLGVSPAAISFLRRSCDPSHRPPPLLLANVLFRFECVSPQKNVWVHPMLPPQRRCCCCCCPCSV